MAVISICIYWHYYTSILLRGHLFLFSFLFLTATYKKKRFICERKDNLEHDSNKRNQSCM